LLEAVNFTALPPDKENTAAPTVEVHLYMLGIDEKRKSGNIQEGKYLWWFFFFLLLLSHLASFNVSRSVSP